MVIRRGEIWWANLPEPSDSEPGFRRPVLIVQSDFFNATKINTLVALAITTNRALAEMPGNVVLSRAASGLPKESVVNITQILTIDKRLLLEYVETVSERKMEQVEKGLRLVLSL
jgi:mRNA interferase MazF